LCHFQNPKIENQRAAAEQKGEQAKINSPWTGVHLRHRRVNYAAHLLAVRLELSLFAK
jgi:hypothetical protein